MISVIIPTLNEEQVIGAAIQALLPAPEIGEILVVDGGSTDRTASLVRAFGPPVRLLDQDPHDMRGRAAAYNQAACIARGDVLLFLHADTRLPGSGISAIERALADPSVVGGGFLPWFGQQSSGLTGLALAVIERAWRFRTQRFTWFAGDQAPFIRRDAFFVSGGYPRVRLAEDWAFASRLRSLGKLMVIDESVRVSARRHLANGVITTLLVTASVEVMYRAGIGSGFLTRWYRHWLPRDR